MPASKVPPVRRSVSVNAPRPNEWPRAKELVHGLARTGHANCIEARKPDDASTLLRTMALAFSSGRNLSKLRLRGFGNVTYCNFDLSERTLSRRLIEARRAFNAYRNGRGETVVFIGRNNSWDQCLASRKGPCYVKTEYAEKIVQFALDQNSKILILDGSRYAEGVDCDNFRLRNSFHALWEKVASDNEIAVVFSLPPMQAPAEKRPHITSTPLYFAKTHDLFAPPKTNKKRLKAAPKKKGEGNA